MLKLGYALAVAIALAFSALYANAQEIEIGSGVVCDKPEEMKRFVQVYKDDAQAAVEQVNAEFNSPTACVPVTVAFIRGSPIAKENSWIITSILVVGLYTPGGWARIQPHIYYSAFKDAVEERGA